MTLFETLLPFTFRRWLLAQYARAKFDVKLGRDTLISRSTEFEGMNLVMDECTVYSSAIGRGSYIASNSIIRNARVGRFCSIGSGVKISLGRHPTKDFVSTHPAFFSLKKQAGFTFAGQPLFDEHIYIGESRLAVDIGNDVWIGDNVIIADGVEIGNGAVIGTGAVVTRSIDPYSINVGVPARRLRYRFDPQTIALLQHFRWWDKDIEWIKENAPLFADIEQFVKLIQDEQDQ